jgi:glycosyltransferase involved in cell wall biosynthesis
MAHLVFFHNDYPLLLENLPGGGAERVLFHVANQCAQHGHKVSIIARGERGYQINDKLTIHSMGGEFNLAKGSAIAQELKPDVLIATSRGDIVEACVPAQYSFKRFVWFHEICFKNSFSSPETLNANADGFIYISKSQRKYLELKGLDHEKGCVIYNAFNIDIFYPRPVQRSNNRIVYVGALVAEKGLDLLIEAFLLVKKSFPDVELHLFGSEEMWGRAPLYSLRRHEYEMQSIFLRGHTSQKQLAEEFSYATVSVLPTLRSIIDEGLGMAAIEAQGCGCPIIVSDSGGLPEAIDEDKSGFITRNENPHELANKICLFLKFPELRKEFGLNGVKFVQSKFHPEDRYRHLMAHIGVS